MVDIHDIPGDIRWTMATDALVALQLLNNRIFTEVLGEEHTLIEESIWKFGIEKFQGYGSYLSMDANNAGDVAETIDAAAQILFGEGMKSEINVESADKAIIQREHCPFKEVIEEVGGDPDTLYVACLANSTAAIEHFFPTYSMIVSKALCRGDHMCELTVERKRRRGVRGW